MQLRKYIRIGKNIGFSLRKLRMKNIMRIFDGQRRQSPFVLRRVLLHGGQRSAFSVPFRLLFVLQVLECPPYLCVKTS